MRTLRWGETFRELLDTQRQDRRGPMPDPRKTTTTKRLPLTGATAARLLTPLRAGMPALDSIHKPKITTAPTCGRVKEEERNVGVAAFLYAASREADNDFHLIVGRDHTLTPEMYMTVEVSGLPPKGDATLDFTDLNAARSAFKKFFGPKLPGGTYDF